MTPFKRMIRWLDDKRNFIILVNLIIIGLIGFLFFEMSSLWRQIFHLIILVFKPFFVAFVIAYIFEPVVNKIMQMGLKRRYAITIVTIGIFLMIFLLINALIPMLYERITALVGPLTNGLKEIQELLMTHYGR